MVLLVLLVLLTLWLVRRRRPTSDEARVPAAPGPAAMPVAPPSPAVPPPVVAVPAAAVPAAVSAPSRRKTRIRTPFAAPAAGRPAALLKGLEGPYAQRTFGIEADPFWIGTDEDNHLPIEGDDFVSGHHACIRFHEGSLLLYDNGSTNGTFLNEEPVTDTPRPLGLGDRVRCGRTPLVILAPE